MLMEKLDRAIDLAERYVAAQEQIARALMDSKKNSPTMVLTPAAELAESDLVEVEIEKSDDHTPEPALELSPPNDVKDQRQWLKDKLSELGVPFTKKTATTTLQKKYEAEVARLKEIPAVTPEQTAEPTKVSKEEVTKRLMAFAETHGGDAARVVLAQFGAKSLSAVDPGDYEDFVNALDEYAAGKEG